MDIIYDIQSVFTFYKITKSNNKQSLKNYEKKAYDFITNNKNNKVTKKDPFFFWNKDRLLMELNNTIYLILYSDRSKPIKGKQYESNFIINGLNNIIWTPLIENKIIEMCKKRKLFNKIMFLKKKSTKCIVRKRFHKLYIDIFTKNEPTLHYKITKKNKKKYVNEYELIQSINKMKYIYIPIYESIKIDNDIKLCVACLDNDRESIFPCGHLCLCISCMNKINKNIGKCPICMRKGKAFKIYK